MAKQIIITQNDYGICFSTQFTENKLPKDISGCEVKINTVLPDQNTLIDYAQITDPLNGKVEFVINKSYTENPGLCKMYFELLNDNSNITAQSMITYYVLAENGGAE